MQSAFHDKPLLLAFLLASLVLAATPGPGVVYIVTRTLAQGRRAGLLSVAGVALGNLGNAIGASIGLATVFAVSSAAFSVVKWAGAAYLVYLGFVVLRPAHATPRDTAPQLPDRSRLFRDGFLVALLNPKTAIFFAAFLPQFIDPTASAMLQSLLLGAGFVAIAAGTDSAYVMAAAVVAPALAGSARGGAFGRIATACVYWGLGVLTALSGARASK